MFENCEAYVLLSPANRFYFSRVQTSHGCVILTKTEKIFLTDFRYIEMATKALPDWTVKMHSGKLFAAVSETLKAHNVKTVGFEDATISFFMYEKLKDACADVNFVPVSREILLMRAVKTEEEISRIAAAQVVAQKALTKVKAALKPGITEREVAAELLYEMQMLGAEGMSFDTIVAFKENTAMPHYATGNRKLEKNDLILVDMGAKLNGYCSDMTRTFSIGDVGKRLEELHSLVLESQTMAIKQVKAGMTGREVDAIVREFFKANGYEKEFGHSLGHGVGIEIHEQPIIGVMGEEPIKPNTVITIEPGLYIEGVGGVRIEDMVVVREGGCLNLTNMTKSLY